MRTPHLAFLCAGAAAALLLWMAGCAVPQAPTGGPPDDTPPTVEESNPTMGATLFDGDEVELRFNRYIDEGSFIEALSITPPFDQRPEVRWSGRRARISFPEPLQENTTYIITLDTNLRTFRNVELREPIVLAFSTGDRINQGALSGRVVDPRIDEPADGIDIFAYPAPDSLPPDSLPDRPSYRTQTNDEGEFSLSFLREEPYYVIAVDDRNRSRMPDPGEDFAVPPAAVLYAESDPEASPVPDDPVDPAAAEEPASEPATEPGPTNGAPTHADTLERRMPAEELPDLATPPASDPADQPWLLTDIDTIPPEIQRARARARNYLQVRFTERVRLTDRSPDGWTIISEETGDTFTVEEVYMHPDSDREVNVLTEELRTGDYLITPHGVEDRRENPAVEDAAPFEIPEETGTLPDLRFEEITPEPLQDDPPETQEEQDTEDSPPPVEVLEPEVYPTLRFNRPPPEGELLERIAAEDAEGTARSVNPHTENGTVYELRFDPPLAYGEEVALTFDPRGWSEEADSLLTLNLQRISRDELGSISGTVSAEDEEAPIVVELFRMEEDELERPYRTLTAEEDGSFSFENLPESTYRIRTFVDRNGNGRWDGGAIVPYTPPEPVRWVQGTEEVRARWDTVIDEPIDIPPTPSP